MNVLRQPAIGRYAPSPTGRLHKGSLMAALASYLQAKANNGLWLMRIDDVDALRVIPGQDEQILDTLQAFGLYWDGEVYYQSQQTDIYAQIIQSLKQQGHAFDCACTRRQAQTGPMGLEGPMYPGTCRHGVSTGKRAKSIRLAVPNKVIGLNDQVFGHYQQNLAQDIGDFIIRRTDGLTSYQLATAVDDAAQGVTEVVRGVDLLASSPRQIYLHQLLGHTIPRYLHVPILVDAAGEKLGKSNGALPLSAHSRPQSLVAALDLLGQQPPKNLATASIGSVLEWALAHWQVNCIPRQHTVLFTQAQWPTD